MEQKNRFMEKRAVSDIVLNMDKTHSKSEIVHNFLYKDSESMRELIEKKMQIRNKVFEAGSLFKKIKI